MVYIWFCRIGVRWLNFCISREKLLDVIAGFDFGTSQLRMNESILAPLHFFFLELHLRVPSDPRCISQLFMAIYVCVRKVSLREHKSSTEKAYSTVIIPSALNGSSNTHSSSASRTSMSERMALQYLVPKKIHEASEEQVGDYPRRHKTRSVTKPLSCYHRLRGATRTTDNHPGSVGIDSHRKTLDTEFHLRMANRTRNEFKPEKEKKKEKENGSVCFQEMTNCCL